MVNILTHYNSLLLIINDLIMSNINLNKLFGKSESNSSKVDSNITINKVEEKTEIYSDFKLDLEFDEYKAPMLNGEATSKDIKKIINEDAIIQSLKNILNTKFYSRLLNPDMNFDLRSYLFEDLTEAKAFFIGYDITHLLPVYEPRIAIKNVRVTAYYQSSTYVIDLSILIPSMGKNISLSSILSDDGFSFT